MVACCSYSTSHLDALAVLDEDVAVGVAGGDAAVVVVHEGIVPCMTENAPPHAKVSGALRQQTARIGSRDTPNQ